MLYEAHVVELKELIYSDISDDSKTATGCRMRYDISQYTVAELYALAASWYRSAVSSINEEHERENECIAEWEEHLSIVQEMMHIDRVSAIAIAVEPYAAEDEDVLYDGYTLNYRLGLPYSYDWIRGERKVWRQVAASH